MPALLTELADLMITFEKSPEGDVCRPDLKPSPKPIYLGAAAEFLVRVGNSTWLYNARDAMEYVRSRW